MVVGLPLMKGKPSEWRYSPVNYNIAMENGPFEDVFPIENGGYSVAMFVYQRVSCRGIKWNLHHHT